MVVHRKLAAKVTGLDRFTNEIWQHALLELYKSGLVTGTHVGDNNLLNYQLLRSTHSTVLLFAVFDSTAADELRLPVLSAAAKDCTSTEWHSCLPCW